MKIIKNVFILILLVLFPKDQLISQIGGYAGSYLRLVPGTRAQGMGGAYVALANDVTAGFWNPAGLGTMQSVQLGFMWSSLSLDRQYNYAAMVIPTWTKGTLSLSWLNYHVGSIEERNETSELMGNFSNDEHTLLLSYGVKLHRYFSAGATAKVLFHDLADYSASGLGYDIGLQLFPIDKMTIAATMQNINTSIKWHQNRERFLRNTRIGICYRVLRNLNLCMDYEYFNIPGKKLFLLKGYHRKVHFGGEYKLLDRVTIRAGLDHKRLTMGFSLPVLIHKNILEVGYGMLNDPIDGSYVHKLEITFKLNDPNTSTDDMKIPGNRMYAAKIIEINGTTLCIDLGEEHELKKGMEVTVYKKDNSNESSKLVNCCADVINIKKREATLSFLQTEFLTNLLYGQKLVVVYNVEYKKKVRL